MQYRPLMPWAQVLLADALAVPVPTAIVITDLALTAVLVVLLHRLSRRLGAPWLILPAAAAWTWPFARVDHWHPELMLLSVLAAAVLVLVDPRPRPWSLLAIAAVMCGARADTAAAPGAVVVLVGITRRRWTTALTGAGIGALAVAASVILVRLYPDARYEVDVVQLAWNLSPGALAQAAPFLGALLLVPVALALRGVVPPLWPALVWLALQVAMTFVVGRIDEARILLPLAPAVGIAAALAWLELHGRAARRPPDHASLART